MKSLKTIRAVFLTAMVLLILLLAKTVLLDSSSIRINAYNPRLTNEEKHYIRGSILDASGNALAYTEVQEDGTKKRVYPYGAAFAHITGYSLRTKTGLELELNEELLSTSNWKDEIKYLLGDEDIQGNSAVLTIDRGLQQKAYALMNGYKGAVVISEPGTGKILALVSTPSYDPNTVSADWQSLTEDPDSPLYARATQGQYPPGSTFKIITSLAFYRENADWASYQYDCEGITDLGTTTLPCYGQTVHGTQDIYAAFANSCNTFYANAGISIGGSAIKNASESLYMNQKIDFILPQSLSKVVVSDKDSIEMVGETAIGQGKSEITPFQMNMVASVIANRGRLYAPYMVDQIITPSGETVDKHLPTLYNDKVITEEEAAYLESLMEGVVQYGTASSLSWLPCQTFGKTGTAQVDDEDTEEPHSWFTGYTKVDGKVDLAVTVLVENGANSHSAVPIVSQLLEYYYYR